LLAIQGWLLSLLHKADANASDAVAVQTQDLANLLVVVASLRMGFVSHQQNPCVGDLLGRRVSIPNDLLQPLTLLKGEMNPNLSSASA
jgi:hypothetical protein